MDFDINEYKKKTIPILRNFNNFCEENQLKYSIFAGTMLGAIRHKGFIPWDDDVDVAMPRPDYDKFIKLTCNQFCYGYEVVSSYNNSKYYLPFAKIIDSNTTLIEYESCKDCMIGVFIDVFPVDGMPEEIPLQKKWYNYYKKSLTKAMLSRIKFNINNGFVTYIKSIICHLLFNSQSVFSKCDKIASTYSFDASSKVRVYCSLYGDGEILERTAFDEIIDIPFESLKVKCIKDYDYYLKKVYGDYMTPPSSEKQISAHSHYFIDINKRHSFKDIYNILKNNE